jgi:hypothetical protein
VKKLILSIVAASAIVPAASVLSADNASAGGYGYGHSRCWQVWIPGHWKSDGYSKWFVPGHYVTRCR